MTRKSKPMIEVRSPKDGSITLSFEEAFNDLWHTVKRIEEKLDRKERDGE